MKQVDVIRYYNICFEKTVIMKFTGVKNRWIFIICWNIGLKYNCWNSITVLKICSFLPDADADADAFLVARETGLCKRKPV